ncbi:MAG: TonB-dependent receptor [Alistipes sp.]|nr:TonB-dependent receptor [Alistipes sp.]
MCLGLAILAMAIPAQVFAQSGRYDVKGVVVDATGTPVIGASVVEQGTTNGITTDVNGQFQLSVSSAESIVTISFIGYETKALAANSTELQRVVLAEDSAMIDDIVVIGYGTVKKEDMTGSVVAVKADELNRGAVVSTQDMMQGKVPGLQVIPGDGGPNSGSTIRIRGAASLHASNDPLIVIDGVPIANNAGSGMSNPLSLVNPNDIDSFTVLKDASATAIYGSRASNGVIIITTKKGKGNKINFSYNGSFSVSTNSDTMQVMSPEQFVDFVDTNFPVGTANGDAIAEFRGKSLTDWQSLIFRTALSHDHNVGLYGSYKDGKGNIELPYRVSIGYTGQQGTLETSKFDRATLDVSLAPKFLNDHLTVSLNAKGVYTHQNYADGGVVGTAAFYNPTVDPYWRTDDGEIDYSTTNGYYNIGDGEGEQFNPNELAANNPLSMLYDVEKYSNTYRTLGNIAVDYKVHGLEALRFNLNLGMDWSKTNEYDGVNPGSVQAYKDSDAMGVGKYTKKMWLRRNHLLDFYGNYNETWGKHTLDATLGYSWQHFYGGDRDITYYNDTHKQYEKSTGALSQEESYLVSFFGRINYSFDSRYLFTFSLRADGSSKFAQGNRWGYFPSAAFAWNAKSESFLEDVDAVSALKLRLSYGQTGQQEIGNYMYLARYSLSENDLSHMANMGSDGLSHMLSPTAYDPNIKWETTTTYNVGVDFGFLDGLINGSIDVYRRDTHDLLNWVTIPMGANFGTNLLTNVGSIRNQGVEFSLDFNPVRTADWSLRFGINGTFQDTKFTKLNNTTNEEWLNTLAIGTGGLALQVHKTGYSPYTFVTFKQGYDANGKPIQNGLWDLNNNGKTDEGDRYITEKSPSPDFFFGVNLKLSYKNWDFGFNGHGSVGNYAFNAFYAQNSVARVDTRGGLSNFASTVLRTGWLNTSNTKQQSCSDLFLEDASFFRLDDINLGYTFEDLGTTDLDLRIAAGVQNVFVITKYSGVDPEISGVEGIDGTIWPRPRIYSLRLNLNF